MKHGLYVEVPVGIRSAEWNTVMPERTVLIAVHNVTTITRLLDILPIFDSDFRVQVVASWSGSDPFRHGVGELLTDMGVVAVPWEQAKNMHFDLAIAASHHGPLIDINAPLVVLSHGIGYTKYSPGNPETRKPGNPETRKPGNPETRKPTDLWSFSAVGSLRRASLCEFFGAVAR